jgi:hypothetical protein
MYSSQEAYQKNLRISGGNMDTDKVADLARSFSVSCKKLVSDRQLMQTLTSPAVVLVSLTVVNLISSVPLKEAWGESIIG